MKIGLIIVGIGLLLLGPIVFAGVFIPRLRWHVGDGSRFASRLDHALVGTTLFYFGAYAVTQGNGIDWLTRKEIIFGLIGVTLVVALVEQAVCEIKTHRSMRKKQM